ncbi:MAG: hypothetical protein Q9207_001838 [Kuettlingeria erythrocarpa]
MALNPEVPHLDKRLATFDERMIEYETTTLDNQGDVYSVFTPVQKRLIVLMASTAALLSPLSSNIYLPALNTIAADFNVSNSQINLTVTSYLIFQALSPMLVAGWSDNAGRRPAYIACFTLYMGANAALIMQNSYVALLILRCFQSAGSSAMVALCQGVVADVATAADRGTYVAYASVSTILGPTVSPILGGLLSQYFGWRAIFWFLAVFAALVFALLLVFLPETCHKIVGNGSIPPATPMHTSLFGWLQEKRRLGRESKGVEVKRELTTLHHSGGFPNPLATLAVLSQKKALLLMSFVGVIFGVHYLILSAIPSQYSDLYGLDEINLGLVYIPYGFGSTLSAFTTGRLANWNYKRHATRLSFPISVDKHINLARFPIERARLEIALPILYASSVLIALYGWSLSRHVHISGLLVLLFAIGYSVYALYQITSLLIIDLFPGNAATATAANNLIRCFFAAASAACTVPLVESLGLGWAYASAGLVAVSASALLWALILWGPGWRREAALDEELKAVFPT